MDSWRPGEGTEPLHSTGGRRPRFDTNLKRSRHVSRVALSQRFPRRSWGSYLEPKGTPLITRHINAAIAAVHLRLLAIASGERQRGQGTVEYIGMVVMVTLLVAAVAAAAKGWGPDIGSSLKKLLTGAIKKVSGGLGSGAS